MLLLGLGGRHSPFDLLVGGKYAVADAFLFACGVAHMDGGRRFPLIWRGRGSAPLLRWDRGLCGAARRLVWGSLGRCVGELRTVDPVPALPCCGCGAYRAYGGQEGVALDPCGAYAFHHGGLGNDRDL